jgi:hypothetical protein
MRGITAFSAVLNSPFEGPRCRRNDGQRDDYGPIGQARAVREIENAVQQARPGRAEQHFIGVGVQLARAKPAPGRDPAKGIGQGWLDGREIVERQHVIVLCRDH